MKMIFSVPSTNILVRTWFNGREIDRHKNLNLYFKGIMTKELKILHKKTLLPALNNEE
jgi:hypothetical protein